MALLEMSAECEIYFTDNWIATDIQLPDTDFDYSSLDSFISINFYPTVNELIGHDGTSTGRTAYYGMSSIFCYHKKKKLALKLADDVKAFFNGQSLPKDIYIGTGQDKPAIDLDNGFYEARVNFEVSQYS